MALLSDPPPRLSGGVVFDPYGTGLGGPNPLSVWGPGLVGSPTPAVEGGLQQQTPRSVVFNPVQDPSATTFGAGVTPPTGFTVPPDKPDPAAEAAKQAAEGMQNIQKRLLSFDERALRAEEAMGAKLGDLQSYMAATMKPFQPPQQTPMVKQWGSAAMIFAALGSLFTRQPLTTALNAMAGVMKAYREGDQKNLDNSMEIWKANSEQAMKLADFEMQAYRTAMEGIHDQIGLEKEITEVQVNEAVAKMMATGAAFNDQTMMDVAMSSGVPGMVDLVQKRIDAQAKYAEAHNKLEEQVSIQQALREYDHDPANAGKSAAARSEDKKLIMNQWGSGTPLSDEAIHNAALLYAAGGPFQRLATQNLTFSGAGRNDRSRIINEAAKISPQEAMASAPVQEALRAQEREGEIRRLATIATNIRFRANNALQASALVKAASQGVPRGTFLPANFAQMTIQEMQSDPRLATYYVRINSFINEYASAINMGGPARIWDKQHAVELINKYGGVEYVNAAMDALQMELKIAIQSPDTLQRLLIEHPNESIAPLLWEEVQKTEKSLGVSGGGAGAAGGGAAGGAGWSIEAVP